MRAQTALAQVSMAENELPEFPDVSRSAATLRFLFLYSNQIPSVDAGVLATLVNLDVLDMNNNHLTTFSDVSLPALRVLKLGMNRFTTMPTFVNRGSLEELYLNNNDMYTISADEFAGLGNLEKLNLNSTKLSTLPDLQYLSSLTSLSLAKTSIRSASVRASAHLGKLHYLDLQSTQLMELPTICPDSSLTLLLQDNPSLDLCSNSMAWLKQDFFTLNYTDVMGNETGKMWSEMTFDELLALSHPVPKLGDVKRMRILI